MMSWWRLLPHVKKSSKVSNYTPDRQARIVKLVNRVGVNCADGMLKWQATGLAAGLQAVGTWRRIV